MEKFESMQAFALSWALVFLFVVFAAAVARVFWPGSRKGQDEAARSIFRNEDRPAPGEGRV